MGKRIELDQKGSHDVTKQEEWRPTPHMEKWLDTALQSENDTVTKIARASHIAKISWYRWVKDDNFLLWFKTEWDKRIASQAWQLDKIGMKQAKRDHKYWQDMQRRIGNLREDKGVNTAVQVNVVTESKKQKYGI